MNAENTKAKGQNNVRHSAEALSSLRIEGAEEDHVDSGGAVCGPSLP